MWIWTHFLIIQSSDIASGSLLMNVNIKSDFTDGKRKTVRPCPVVRHVNFDAPMFLIDRSKNNIAFHL
jgi:hypothetical protein